MRAGLVMSRQSRLSSQNNNWRQRGHYIMLKESIYQESGTVIIIYALNIIAPKYIKQIHI